MVDVYYCPNVECPFGIILTEVFNTAERCPKCGIQTRKLRFSDMIKLIEEKKKFQKEADSLPDRTQMNQQLGDDEKKAEPISPLDADTAVRMEMSEDEVQRTIDDLRKQEVGEENIQLASGESREALPEDAQENILNELKVIMEQNKVLIRQNELILGSVNLRKLKIS
ncbi:hypothetical protein MUP77_05205 [Candidatus Bathyarchaeota archaeon]|nr:hypothetical protein [Candidatus Bathyarchaeota archaeon]